MSWMIAGYFVAFVASFATFVWWGRRQRTRRAPFKRETKVLRLPGESLQRRIQQFDENDYLRFCAAAVIPLIVAGIGMEISRRCSGWWAVGALGTTALAFAITFAKAAKWLARGAFIRSNHELGRYGERVVGDALAPLERKGWRIFHDFPRQVKDQNFNIDHIAIGPGGVFAIETKTPRKGDARPGKEAHIVEYNGTLLSWPWGENRLGIDQALDNAQWLEGWLHERTGQEIAVRAVLAFPDWMVKDSRTGPLRVVSSSLIAEILAEQKPVLSSAQIDLAARQVEGVCRDVEY